MKQYVIPFRGEILFHYKNIRPDDSKSTKSGNDIGGPLLNGTGAKVEKDKKTLFTLSVSVPQWAPLLHRCPPRQPRPPCRASWRRVPPPVGPSPSSCTDLLSRARPQSSRTSSSTRTKLTASRASSPACPLPSIQGSSCRTLFGNFKEYRYCIIWRKRQDGLFLTATFAPFSIPW